MADKKFLEFLLIRRPHVFQQKIRKSTLLSTALQKNRKRRRYRLLIGLSVLACTSFERRIWTLTRQWFEIVETAFTEKEWSICTCSPKSVLTKGAKAHQRKVGSARLIVYTAHLIRAGLDFQDRVPILSVLGLPLDMVRAGGKVWSSTDGAK